MTAAAPLVIDLDTIQDTVTLPAAVQAAEDAFRVLADGRVTQPSPMGFDLPAGEVHVKSAHLGPGHPLVVKLATGFRPTPGTVCRPVTGSWSPSTPTPDSSRQSC